MRGRFIRFINATVLLSNLLSLGACSLGPGPESPGGAAIDQTDSTVKAPGSTETENHTSFFEFTRIVLNLGFILGTGGTPIYQGDSLDEYNSSLVRGFYENNALDNRVEIYQAYIPHIDSVVVISPSAADADYILNIASSASVMMESAMISLGKGPETVFEIASQTSRAQEDRPSRNLQVWRNPGYLPPGSQTIILDGYDSEGSIFSAGQVPLQESYVKFESPPRFWVNPTLGIIGPFSEEGTRMNMPYTNFFIQEAVHNWLNYTLEDGSMALTFEEVRAELLKSEYFSQEEINLMDEKSLENNYAWWIIYKNWLNLRGGITDPVLFDPWALEEGDEASSLDN